jgi:hypothetical protein
MDYASSAEIGWMDVPIPMELSVHCLAWAVGKTIDLSRLRSHRYSAKHQLYALYGCAVVNKMPTT